MLEFFYNGEPKKLSRVVALLAPNISYGYFNTLLRKRDIKIDGVRVNTDIVIKNNTKITIFANDAKLNAFEPTIIYQDDKILIVHKRRGIATNGDENALEAKLRVYFNNSSMLACHRLDTNTEGLVIFAFDENVFENVKLLFKNHQIEKFYRALLYGKFSVPRTLRGFLKVDKEQGRALISKTFVDGYTEIITEVTPIEVLDNYTLAEIKLVTGKTHQIRAHLSSIGFPILGDPKYSTNDLNDKFSYKKQALTAYKLVFLSGIKGMLSYLSDKTFTTTSDFN